MSEFMTPDRMSEEYIAATVGMKPKGDDPKDVRIGEIIAKEALQEPWAQDAFKQIDETQRAYMRDAITRVDDPEYVGKATQTVLGEVSSAMHATIVEGQEYLEAMPQGTPVLIMANHLGTYKLTGINPQTDLGPNVPQYKGYDFMYPYPLYIAGMQPVAESLGDRLTYASNDFPGVFGQVHTAAGFIHVPPAALVTGNRTEALINQTREVIDRYPNSAIVNFPEGGTSGKYNEAGPYDLLAFKTGGLVIASQMDMPIVPVAQYFDPKEGMQLKVFEPFRPGTGTREEYQAMADKMRTEMQEWLSAKEQASAA